MSGNLFTRLRKKPKHVRDNIAFAVASGFTGLVLLVWFMTTPTSLFGEKEITSEEPKLFKTFFEQLNQQFASVKSALPNAATISSTSPAAVDSAPAGISISSDLSSTTKASSTRKEVFIIPVKASSTATSTASSTSL